MGTCVGTVTTCWNEKQGVVCSHDEYEKVSPVPTQIPPTISRFGVILCKIDESWFIGMMPCYTYSWINSNDLLGALQNYDMMNVRLLFNLWKVICLAVTLKTITLHQVNNQTKMSGHHHHELIWASRNLPSHWGKYLQCTVLHYGYLIIYKVAATKSNNCKENNTKFIQFYLNIVPCFLCFLPFFLEFLSFCRPAHCLTSLFKVWRHEGLSWYCIWIWRCGWISNRNRAHTLCDDLVIWFNVT